MPLLHQLQEEKERAADVAAGSVRGWVGLTERMWRRFFGEWIVRPTTRHFNGDDYSDVGIVGAFSYVLADGELTDRIGSACRTRQPGCGEAKLRSLNV